MDLSSLRDIGLANDTVQAALASAHPDDARLARVVEIQRDQVVVHDGLATHRALVWPALRLALEVRLQALVVGDWVWWQPVDAALGWVMARVAPRNLMSRLDPEGGRQPLVANVDAVLIVMGLDHDFNLRRLDRFLVLAAGAKAQPVIVLTKADRCDDAERRVERTLVHVGRPLPVVALDARAARAREALAPWLVRGHTLVTVGSSGAGKTTLGNTLTGSAGLAGAVREGDERGRHTTTVRTLRPMAGGACLIDTPGLRQLRLDVDDQTLRDAYADIGSLAVHCRFRDCRHESEPGCAVRGVVPDERLFNFRKLLREHKREGNLPLVERHRRLAVYKRRTRDARERLEQKGR